MREYQSAALFAVVALFCIAADCDAPMAQSQTCPTGTTSNFCPTVETEQYLVGSTNPDSPPFVYTSGYFAANDGGGGVLYARGFSPCILLDNGGSVVKQTNGSGYCYFAQTFPTNILQWGADPSGMNSSTAAVQAELDAQASNSATAGAVLYFPPGTFSLAGIILPNSLGPTVGLPGLHLYCAGKDVTTLQLPKAANTWMFATWNYANNSQPPLGEPPVEINGCTINLKNTKQSEGTAVAGIIIQATVRSRIYDNEIDNSYGPALSLTSQFSNGTGCNTTATHDDQIIQNVFIGSYAAAVSTSSGTCTSFAADSVIRDNIFASNGVGLMGQNNNWLVNPDYQVDIVAASGWGYRGNKSFGGGCGELLMLKDFSSVITDNRFDISSNFGSSSCPEENSSSAIESIVLSIGANKGFTFSSNSVENASGSPPSGTTWDALEATNDNVGCAGRITANDNVFANLVATVLINAINYKGACAATVPFPAVGNVYSPNVIAPSNPEIITGTEQYLTVTANATQVGSVAYLPVSGFTNAFGTTSANVAQSWGQTGFFTVDANCGQLVTAPGTGKTYTFQLMVNASLVPVTCTFSGTSTTGVGSGATSPGNIANGATVNWKATQSSGSGATNPTLNLVFAIQ